jgi:hypothetical protein
MKFKEKADSAPDLTCGMMRSASDDTRGVRIFHKKRPENG